MRPRTKIRETLQQAGLSPVDVSHSPAGGWVAWLDDDATTGDDLTRAVMAIENETPFTYKGESGPANSHTGLRFVWGDDVPKHRAGRNNPRAISLGKYAEWMNLSRTDARRALTGLHHATTPVWKDDRQTPHVLCHSPGVLPESETGQHSYHYYVE